MGLMSIGARTRLLLLCVCFVACSGKKHHDGLFARLTNGISDYLSGGNDEDDDPNDASESQHHGSHAHHRQTNHERDRHRRRRRKTSREHGQYHNHHHSREGHEARHNNDGNDHRTRRRDGFHQSSHSQNHKNQQHDRHRRRRHDRSSDYGDMSDKDFDELHNWNDVEDTDFRRRRRNFLEENTPQNKHQKTDHSKDTHASFVDLRDELQGRRLDDFSGNDTPLDSFLDETESSGDSEEEENDANSEQSNKRIDGSNSTRKNGAVANNTDTPSLKSLRGNASNKITARRVQTTAEPAFEQVEHTNTDELVNSDDEKEYLRVEDLLKHQSMRLFLNKVYKD